MTITSKMICDSISEDGIRLTTLELKYPRFIHSEFMTHRQFCLSGDSILEFNLPSGTTNKGYKRIFTMSLREFSYKWFNGDSLGRTLRHRLKNMRIRQLNEDTHKIESCTVKDCFISGEKEVYEITVGDMKVKGSQDHKILTTSGWKTIQELKVNTDYIITRSFGKLDDDLLDPTRLKKFGNRWKSTWLNQIRDIKLNDQNWSCFDCGTELLIAKHNLHHLTPVYEDSSKAFDYDNVVSLCLNCHDERHRIQGWQGKTYLYGKPIKLTNKIFVGREETYDLEMDSEYENFIANGIVVHNSRNASSNRAMPVSKVISNILEDPAMPIFWGKDQPGMQAREECTKEVRDPAYFYEPNSRKSVWVSAMENSREFAEAYTKAGYHKQVVNRLLEPYQHITVILTSTEWENFFNLRLHPDAQPEIHELARVMKESMDSSEPERTGDISWHLPYISREEFVDITNPMEDLLKYSVARCARVSYLNHDGSKPDTDKDLKLYDMLLESKHMSPFEHQAKPINNPYNNSAGELIGYYFEEGVTHMDKQSRYWSGNFRGWIQNRQLVEE